jgi:hypothetical protein
LKNKIVALYDGSIDTANNLSLDELIEHISFRVNGLQPKTLISELDLRRNSKQTICSDFD